VLVGDLEDEEAAVARVKRGDYSGLVGGDGEYVEGS
jgi:hypothetical protein